MFDIGWGELIVIGVVALIAIGPKELPTVLRTIGQWMTKLRRMASEFQGQFQEAMREAEMADLKKQVDDVTAQAKGYADFDPIGDVRKEIESTQQQIESTFTDKPAEIPSTPATVESSVASSAPASAEATPASTEPVVAANVEAPFNVDAPVATPAPAPAPPELEGVGAAAAPVRPDAGGKPA